MRPSAALIEELDFACHDDIRGRVLSLHLFGIRNAEILTVMSGRDMSDLLRAVDASDAYRTEFNKMKKIGLELQRQGIDISKIK